MPFRSPPLLIPGGFGRKICIESESGRVTVRKGRRMKNISGRVKAIGAGAFTRWGIPFDKEQRIVRSRKKSTLPVEARWDVYLKGGWSLFWHFVTNRVFSLTWFQLDSFSRRWNTFPHFSERSLIFVRGIFHSLLLDDRSMMEEDDRISKKGKGKRVLELLKVKIKKRRNRKEILVPFRLSSKHRNPLRLLFPLKR